MCRVRVYVRVRKIKKMRSKTKSTFFSGYSYSRTIACCGYLISNQKNVLIYTTHIKKLIAKLHSFTQKLTTNNRSEISFDTGAGAGAMFMKRRALEPEPEPELCHFYDGSAALLRNIAVI